MLLVVNYEPNNNTEMQPLFNEDLIAEHTASLRQISEDCSREAIINKESELDAEMRAARSEDDEQRFADAKERLRVLQYARHHGDAAERYLYAMEQHPEQLWCNNDTSLGEYIGQYIENAPAPDEQRFVPFSDPRITRALQAVASVVYERLVDEAPLRVPVRSFITAQLFDSGWEQGRGEIQKPDDRTGEIEMSAEMIQRYASMPAETAPEVESAYGFLQPDGKIVYMGINSHRVAAAVVRGDELLAVRQVKLVHVDEQLV